MMTQNEIGRIINPDFPGVYAPTNEPTKLIFEDGNEIVGYFEFTNDSKKLENENKFTFVEFGEKAQNYRSTNDTKYITIVEGNLLRKVEYPSYSSIVLQRLKKFKASLKETNTVNWVEYKANWVESVKQLYSLIMDRWLDEYNDSGLMDFALVPTKRFENNLGEYLTSVLEITLANNRLLVIEPIAGITSDYDGKLDFYMVGAINRKVSILRKILESGETTWVLAKSHDQKSYQSLNQQLFLKQVDEWLQ